ncbi:MAG: hypothetical protein V1722_04140 [Candidatus Micrarchaeota archaeon]
MDPSRIEQIERWAKHVRESNGEWKSIHSQFIDAQFQKALAFYDRLLEMPNGKAKIAELRNIKNLEAAPMLK